MANLYKLNFKELILFEDHEYIIVNKPPYLSTLEDRNDPVNLLQLAKDYHPDAQMGHRLDKETSGVIAIAKTPEAYRHLSIQFEKRQVNKLYRAVVEGIHDFDEEAIEAPLHVMANGIVKVSPQGKPSLTMVKTIQAYRQHTLVGCILMTGRMHQIRVHLSWKKAPIVADETYGGKPFYLSDLKRKFNLKKGTEEQPLIKRVALHAYRLTFYGPDQRVIEAEAPYPKDMAVLIKQLEKNS